MKSQCFKMIHFALVALMSINMVACDNARFDNDSALSKTDDDNSINAIEEDLTFISDSFERTDVFIDLANSVIYGWRGFIDDGGTNVLGFEGNNTGIKIFDSATMGPAFDGDRALYIYGRDGADIQTLHVVSQPYDLSNFNSVILNFRYLTFGLNDAGDATQEYLRVQVCKATDLNACGANADILDGNALKDDANWATVFEKVPGAEDDALNGKNHVLANWQTALAVIDLNDPAFVGNKGEFVFRIVGRMRDGFTVATTIPGTGDHHCKCKKHHDHKDCHHNKDCRHHHSGCKHSQHDDSKCPKHKNCKDSKCKYRKSASANSIATNTNKKDDCDRDCNCDCDDDGGDDVVVPADGTLKDGIAIDKVIGIATQRDIGDIF